MSQSAAPAEIRFAPEFDQPVRYMLRTRSYYLGLGYVPTFGRITSMLRLRRLKNR